ncbi:MAG TPA: SRPBCC family protein [Ktedonobacterales bacterium]|nr:SRPBCC family protein [Ktedonobacterales bacterium]
MPTIHKSTVVNASIDTVFDALDDPEALPQYIPPMTKVRAVHRSAQRLGDSFQATYSVLGMHFDEAFTYTAYVRPTTLVTRFEGPMSGTMSAALTPQDGATTRVDLAIDYQMPGGVVGKVADALLVERMNEGNAEHMLENLKLIVESRAATPPA